MVTSDIIIVLYGYSFLLIALSFFPYRTLRGKVSMMLIKICVPSGKSCCCTLYIVPNGEVLFWDLHIHRVSERNATVSATDYSWKDIELVAHDPHFVIRNSQKSGEDFYLQFLKMLGHRLYYLWLLRKVWHEEALRNTFEENLKYYLSEYNKKKTIIIFFWIVLFIFLSFFFLPLFCFFVFSINCKWHIK